uniref:Uncharacterized protein n=1 Tax=Sphingobacterium sp. (strain 21) TaxID=743722 RepID=F4C7C0_SPHS2
MEALDERGLSWYLLVFNIYAKKKEKLDKNQKSIFFRKINFIIG